MMEETAMMSRSLLRLLCLLCNANDDKLGASEESEKANDNANSDNESGSGEVSLTLLFLLLFLLLLVCCATVASSFRYNTTLVRTTDDKEPSLSAEERLTYVTNTLQIELYSSNGNGSDTGRNIVSAEEDLESGNQGGSLHCAICLQGFRDGQPISKSDNCDHRFCKDCITQWLLKKDECPYCRQDYLKRNSAGNNERVTLPNLTGQSEEACNEQQITINDERESVDTDSTTSI